MSANAGIYITVPIGYPEPAATVCHSDACLPELVIPVDFPQHAAHEQYAEALTVTTLGDFPSTALSKDVPTLLGAFALAVILVEIWIILSTGSSITVSEIMFFSISTSFLYFTLYLISFNPFFPSCITVSLVSVFSFETSFVTVSNGISTCSITIFSVIVTYSPSICSVDTLTFCSDITAFSSVFLFILIFFVISILEFISGWTISSGKTIIWFSASTSDTLVSDVTTVVSYPSGKEIVT